MSIKVLFLLQIIKSELKWSKGDKLEIEHVEEITWAEPGEEGGLEMLRTFLLERLQYYGISSNEPSKKHQSNLSPWLHFGGLKFECYRENWEILINNL